MNVMEWLLDSDPSIRWQVMQALEDAPSDVVDAERAKVATTGWGQELLARQGPDGHWGGQADATSWTASREWHCLESLAWLRSMGLDPHSPQARRATDLVRDNVTWKWWDDHPFFVGEVEPCINGRVVATGAYFGQDVQGLVDRLLGEQMADGGWNCEQENGATVGSFGTTINVLEGLLEHDRATGGTPELAVAQERGREYLLERGLMRRRTTGEIIDPAFTRFSFPNGWHYDVLRGPRLPPCRRCRAGRAAPRGHRACRVETGRRRTLAARESPPRAARDRDGGTRRSAKPMEHAARDACPALVSAAVERRRALSRATWRSPPCGSGRRRSCPW